MEVGEEVPPQKVRLKPTIEQSGKIILWRNVLRTGLITTREHQFVHNPILPS